MNVEDCISAGLLSGVAPDIGKAHSSLLQAGHKLELAKKELEHEIYENAVISAYASMFHSARALLFMDGYKERSHYAVFVYVNEKYGHRIEQRHLNELNSLRLCRHELMYGISGDSETGKDEAGEAIESAKGFLEAVGRIVSSKPRKTR